MAEEGREDFDAELSASEHAWLRELERAYVTARDHAARSVVAFDASLSAPTTRCRLLIDWLLRLEADAGLGCSQRPGGPSEARLIIRAHSSPPSKPSVRRELDENGVEVRESDTKSANAAD